LTKIDKNQGEGKQKNKISLSSDK